MLDVVELLHHRKQIQWLLLYRFDNINKINYYLRNIPYTRTAKWIQLFDRLEERKRDILFGTGLTTSQIAQSQLPTKRGGLALRTASHFYSAASLACKVKNCLLMPLLLKEEVIRATDAHINQSIQAALIDFNSKCLPDDRINNIFDYFAEKRQINSHPKLQSKLFGKLENKLKAVVLEDADKHIQCLFQQFQHKKCHNWLQTDPWLVQFSNLEFLMALYRRFRIKIFEKESRCSSCLVRVMDFHGDHGTMCSYSSQNPKRRHDAVKLLLVEMGRTAGLITKLEQNPTTSVSANIKPADVLFENYYNGKHCAIDVTIVSPFRSGVESGATSTFMHTGDQAYNTKLKKYDQYIFKDNVIFQPFVIEEFGAIHHEAMTVFNKLCGFIATRQDRDLTEVKFHYSKLISSILHRQNSRAILTRIP